MSINVMTMEEINEVSGGDLVLDSAGYGALLGSTYGLITAGAEGAAYFGPYGAAIFGSATLAYQFANEMGWGDIGASWGSSLYDFMSQSWSGTFDREL